MLKELLARHRSMRVGVSLLGAAALAVGFASPALASENSGSPGNNVPSQNVNILEGGSNTAYLIMQAEADLFNASPGCDLTAGSGTEQELDYGCPGLNGDPGTNQSAPVDTTFGPGTTTHTGTVADKKVFLASIGSGAAQIIKGDVLVSSTCGGIPNGSTVVTIVTVTGGFKVKFNNAATSACTTDSMVIQTTPPFGENGTTTFNENNPFNDVLVEEPSLGSSNGILELEGTGNSGHVGHSLTTDDPSGVGPVAVSPLDVARSSRAPKETGDYSGLNFSAYAADAVSFIYWTSVNGSTFSSNAAADPAGCIDTADVDGGTANNLSHSADLLNIWNGTWTTWNKVCPNASGATLTTLTAAPIKVYMAQNGSGTESTWASLLGLPSSGFPYGGETNDHVIFENETSEILANGDMGNAIFFFSYGKYKKECTPNSSLATSNAVCTGSTTSTIQMGSIDGVTPSKASIYAELPCTLGASCPKVFPGDRYLFNVYPDGSNTNLPNSAAADNAVSEDGFMCKPSTAKDVDPNSNTGATYLSEIQANITAQGFFPLPLMVEDGETAPNNTAPGSGSYVSTDASIPNPAWSTIGGSKYDGLPADNIETGATWKFPASDVDDDYSAISDVWNGGSAYTGVYDGGGTAQNPLTGGTGVSVTPSTGNPVGYCLTETTTGTTTAGS